MITGLIGTGSVDMLKTFLEQTPGISNADKISFVNQAMQSRKGLIHDMSNAESPVSMLPAGEKSRQLKVLEESQEQAGIYSQHLAKNSKNI